MPQYRYKLVIYTVVMHNTLLFKSFIHDQFSTIENNRMFESTVIYVYNNN